LLLIQTRQVQPQARFDENASPLAVGSDRRVSSFLPSHLPHEAREIRLPPRCCAELTLDSLLPPPGEARGRRRPRGAARAPARPASAGRGEKRVEGQLSAQQRGGRRISHRVPRAGGVRGEKSSPGDPIQVLHPKVRLTWLVPACCWWLVCINASNSAPYCTRVFEYLQKYMKPFQ
jgi:hypothetical protein